MLTAFLSDPKVWLAPIGSGVVWWLARRDMAAMRKRVMECEIDRASLHEKDRNREVEVARLSGTVETLTSLLRKEIHLG